MNFFFFDITETIILIIFFTKKKIAIHNLQVYDKRNKHFIYFLF